jgi:hypothetical protein
MPAPKIIWDPRPENSLQDKQKVESLIKRLNEVIQKDPGMAKKAATVLEQWLKKTKP